MPLVKAKCTQCGANLEVDNTQDAAICKFCGTPFIVEKAINNYNTYVTNNFSGANVTVMGHESVDTLVELGEKYMENGIFDVAIDYYRQVKEYYPSDYRGPFGTILAITHRLGLLPSSLEVLEEIKKDRKKLRVLAPDSVRQRIESNIMDFLSNYEDDKYIFVCPQCKGTYNAEKNSYGLKCPDCARKVVSTDFSQKAWKVLLDDEKNIIKKNSIKNNRIPGFFG